jgi:hypothetical protein
MPAATGEQTRSPKVIMTTGTRFGRRLRRSFTAANVLSIPLRNLAQQVSGVPDGIRVKIGDFSQQGSTHHGH